MKFDQKQSRETDLYADAMRQKYADEHIENTPKEWLECIVVLVIFWTLVIIGASIVSLYTSQTN